MAKGPDRLNIRVGLEGGDQVRRGLENLGEAGQRAFQALVRASADSKRATEGLAGQLTSLRSRFQDVADAAGRIGERFSFVGGEIARVGATITAALGVRALVDMTSAWADLTGRIRNAIPATEDAADIMQRLVDISQRSYQEVGNVANAYATTARSLRELGLSTEKSLDLFEAINNAMTLSGAKGVQAESVMRALTRALQEGALKGANFQAVLDNGGRILDVLADHMNTTVAGLKNMAKNGQITGKVLQEALLGALPKLREDLENMDDTVADGFLKIRNAMLQWVGTTDEAAGFSRTLAAALVWVAENFDLVAKVVTVAVGAFTLLKAVGLAVELFALAKAVLGLIGPLTQMSALLLASPWTLMAVGLVAAAAAVLALTGNLDGFMDTVSEAISSLMGFGTEATAAGKEAGRALDGANKSTNKLGAGTKAAADAMKDLTGTTKDMAKGTKDATKGTDELGDVAKEATQTLKTGVDESTSSVVVLGKEIENAAQSLIKLGEAAKKANKETQNLSVGTNEGGGGKSGSGSGNRSPGFASGGRVRGPGSSTSDSIVARLSNGEYVIRAKAVRKYGAALFDALNRMKLKKLPAFRDGGAVSLDKLVGGLSRPVAEARFASGGLVQAQGTSVPIVKQTSGRPLNLTIGDTTFTGLSAPEDVAAKLTQFATSRQVRRAGRMPSWYRG